MSEAQEFNPFDTSGYSTTPEVKVEQAETQTEPQAEVETTVSEPETQTTEVAQETTTAVELPQQNEVAETTEEEVQFEWPNDVARDIYEKLVNGNIDELADMIYEQKVLSNVDAMSDADAIKLKMAYDYPDLTPEEIEEEFNSKYSIDKDFDESLLSDEEIAAKRKMFEKQEKALARDMKKESRTAKDYLASMKQEISFPDILSQVKATAQQSVNPEELVSQFLANQEAEESKAIQQARAQYLNSIEEGLKSFEGFNVNYKDEDVQFDGKFNLTPDEKVSLSTTMKDFDLEEFYGNRYYKDGKYDTKQLAEDIYFLNNKDKIMNSVVTQAVSKAKADLLKAMKNIDYNDTPRVAAAASANDDYDSMVSKLYSI